MGFEGFVLESQLRIPQDKYVKGVVVSSDKNINYGHVIDEDGVIHWVCFNTMQLVKKSDISEKLKQVIAFLKS